MNQVVIRQMQALGWELENLDRPGIYVRKLKEEEKLLGQVLPDSRSLLKEFEERLASSLKSEN